MTSYIHSTVTTCGEDPEYWLTDRDELLITPAGALLASFEAPVILEDFCFVRVKGEIRADNGQDAIHENRGAGGHIVLVTDGGLVQSDAIAIRLSQGGS